MRRQVSYCARAALRCPLRASSAHQLPVGLLAPGVQLDLALGVAAGLLVVAAPLVVVGQVGQRVERPLVQPLALQQLPLLEGRAVAQRELGQEIAAVERDRLLHPRGAAAAALQAAMGVGLTGRQQRGKGGHIQVVVAGLD